ncbi:hypothetical protein ig2599ANME_0086 [groundwater metagenome]
MKKSIWLCERCQKKFDSDEGEGGVILTEDENSYVMGKLNPIVPYHRVCYGCADELLAVVAKCNKNCFNCEATMKCGLSICDCLKFQLRFEVIKLPPPERPFRSSMEEANEIMKIFSRFYAMPCRG